jgi:hypothetical protein
VSNLPFDDFISQPLTASYSLNILSWTLYSPNIDGVVKQSATSEDNIQILLIRVSYFSVPCTIKGIMLCVGTVYAATSGG